ncbi:hypothetical protein KSS87_006871 [Heliosperma pusillum]|nr:hypothetical protein KSS87_006871 [Heliosperma pusillum]
MVLNKIILQRTRRTKAVIESCTSKFQVATSSFPTRVRNSEVIWILIYH